MLVKSIVRTGNVKSPVGLFLGTGNGRGSIKSYEGTVEGIAHLSHLSSQIRRDNSCETSQTSISRREEVLCLPCVYIRSAIIIS